MSQGHRTLKDRMHRRLMLAVRWVSGPELADGLSTSAPAIEDALADLVLEGLAEFDADQGYRLKASQLCRDATRMLLRRKVQRAVAGQSFEGCYRIGVAEHREGLGLVTYELEFPASADGPDFLDLHMAQINQILKFTEQGMAHA